MAGGLEDIQFSEVGIKTRGSDIEGCYAGLWLTEQDSGWAEEMLSIFCLG